MQPTVAAAQNVKALIGGSLRVTHFETQLVFATAQFTLLRHTPSNRCHVSLHPLIRPLE